MLVAFPSPGARASESSELGVPGGPRLPDFGLRGPEPGPPAAAEGSGGSQSRFARLLEEQARRLEESEGSVPEASGGSVPRNQRSESSGAHGESPGARGGDAVGAQSAGDGAGKPRSASRESEGSGRRREAGASARETPGQRDEDPEAGFFGRVRGRLASKRVAQAGKPGSGKQDRSGAAAGAAGDGGKAAREPSPAGKEIQPGAAEGRGGGKAARRQGKDLTAAALAGATGEAAPKAAGPGEGERRAAALRSSAARPGLVGLGGDPGGASVKDGGTAVRLEGTRGKARLVILDLRDRSPASGEAAEGGNGRAGKGLVAASEEARRSPSSAEREFLTLLKGHSAERGDPGSPQGGDGQKSAPSLRTFQERLVPEVVRHTGIILREGGSGEIRLLLKPESLGAVRIRLSLGESSLEGRIVVENNTVKDLMEASLEHLKQALRAGGFQSAALEVTVGNRHNGHQAESPPSVVRVAGAGYRELEAAVAPLMELISLEPSLINLVV